jgi:hypothetical protein
MNLSLSQQGMHPMIELTPSQLKNIYYIMQRLRKIRKIIGIENDRCLHFSCIIGFNSLTLLFDTASWIAAKDTAPTKSIQNFKPAIK